MATDLPPQVVSPPAYYAPAPECRYLTNSEAQLALQRLRAQLPGTSFEGAQPSEICGMVRVRLASGRVAYTDATGRYFMLAFALDTHKGEPADNDRTVARAYEDREELTPGVLPPGMEDPTRAKGPRMSPIPNK